jgi:hypothetical protein
VTGQKEQAGTNIHFILFYFYDKILFQRILPVGGVSDAFGYSGKC